MQERRERWWVWAAFAALCLLAGSRWILADALPKMGSTLRSEAWACALAGAGCAVVARLRRMAFPPGRKAAGIALVGAGLLAAPSLGAALHGAAGESFNRTLMLTFVPVVALVASGRSGWWPGLAGLTGALLVLPFTAPGGVGGYAGLVVPPMAVGVACAVIGKRVHNAAAEWAGVLLLGGGALGLVVVEAARTWSSGEPAHPFGVAAVGMDVLEQALTVAVVLRVGGERYTARYFLVLLVMLLEGAVLLRTGLSLRFGIGMLLLAAAAVGLLRQSGTGADTSTLNLR